MDSQQFAWDSANERFFYISHQEKRYVEINKINEPEVYDFLMHVYCTNWRFCGDVEENYELVKSMEDVNK